MIELWEFIKGFDLHTLLTIGIVAWFFNKSIGSKFDGIRSEIGGIHKEFNEIHKEFKFINIRLSRVEGTVYGKDIYKPPAHEKDSND